MMTSIPSLETIRRRRKKHRPAQQQLETFPEVVFSTVRGSSMHTQVRAKPWSAVMARLHASMAAGRSAAGIPGFTCSGRRPAMHR